VKGAVGEAKSRVAELGAGVIDSELLKKNLPCIKYEIKRLKMREISEVVSSIDPPILQVLRDEITATKSRAGEAKATTDEANQDLVDAQGAASDGQRADFHDVIAIVTVRPNIDDNFVSRE
jgi:hypothetical protein